MERWANIDRDDVHLATIRVFKESSRIKLYLPENPSNPEEPGEYELEMVQESVENQLVVAEKEKEPGSRARTTILAGTVKHECNLRPLFTEKYRKRVRDRHREVNTRSRQIKMIEEVTPGRGSVNMLSSGVANASAFSDLVVRALAISSRLLQVERVIRTENKTETSQGPIRTHGSYAQESASRFTFQAFCREGDVADQTPAREDAAARGVLEGDSDRDRVPTPKWRTQRHLGVEGKLQRGGTLFIPMLIERNLINRRNNLRRNQNPVPVVYQGWLA
jgi:hypothetical protein